MAQSSDVVGLVALHEWEGCWGPGAQVSRASPHGAEGARVGEPYCITNAERTPFSSSSSLS